MARNEMTPVQAVGATPPAHENALVSWTPIRSAEFKDSVFIGGQQVKLWLSSEPDLPGCRGVQHPETGAVRLIYHHERVLVPGGNVLWGKE